MANKKFLIQSSSKDAVYLSYKNGYTKKKNTQQTKNGGVYLKTDIVYSKYERERIFVDNAAHSKYADGYLTRSKTKLSSFLNDSLPLDKAIYLSYLGDYVTEADVIETLVDKMTVLKKDAVYSKYHRGKLFINNAIKLEYCKDFIHITKVVFSTYERTWIALHHTAYIFGVGYIFKKNEKKARKDGFKVNADMVTEYEERKKQKEKT